METRDSETFEVQYGEKKKAISRKEMNAFVSLNSERDFIERKKISER